MAYIQDGIGERLINVDASVLNDPAFRAAGWIPDASAIKRTYSPPIPTAGSSDYFQAPPQSAGLPSTPGIGDDEDEIDGTVDGGGAKDSNDTVGPAPIGGRRNRRRREQLREEEDDSSDLSDESDEDDAKSLATSQRPTHQIRFAKMPVRERADSSPARTRERATSSLERAGSEGEQRGGPSLMVTSPSRPPERNWSKREHYSVAQATKARARRDTATSSEISSDGDTLDPSIFKRHSIKKPGAWRSLHRHSAEKIDEERGEAYRHGTHPSTAGYEEIGKSDDSPHVSEGRASQDGRSEDDDMSDDVSLASSGFSEDDGDSLLACIPPIATSPLEPGIAESPLKRTSSPHKSKPILNPERAEFQELPPPRPISIIQPVSALGAAIRAKNKRPGNVFERFASVDGKDAADPLYLKIFLPFSSLPDEPLELQIRRASNDGQAIIVADAIGLALLKYGDHEIQPRIEGEKANVNKWTFRIMDDGEVDDDFPPLGRTKAILDFANNNLRPTRGRARDKPWDEFGLVEASESQLRENERDTPLYSQEAREAQVIAPSTQGAQIPQPSGDLRASLDSSALTTTSSLETTRNLIGSIPPTTTIGSPSRPHPPMRSPSTSDPPPPRSSSFAASTIITGRPAATRQNTNPFPQNGLVAAGLPYFRSKSSTPLDVPATPIVPTVTERSGAKRTLHIHFTTPDLRQTVTRIDTTTDTYISEILNDVTSRFQLDKGLYVLRVTGTSTIAPTDRMVEALGSDHNDLDLTRRRFMTEGAIDLSGSPGSSSPNTPLLLTNTGTPTRSGKSGRTRRRAEGESGFAGGYTGGFLGYTTTGGGYAHPLAQQAELMSPGAPANSSYRRWNVTRRQPMSFTPSAPRVIAVDGENLYIMPPEGKHYGHTGDDKTRTVHFSAVVGTKVTRKHPKEFRVVVFKEVGREQKRYDFEAATADQAKEIVGVIEQRTEAARSGVLGH